MPRLAANLSFLFPDAPFLERVDRAAAAGFRGVESMYPEDVAPAALTARLADSGMQWVLLNTPAGDFAAGERGLAALPGQEGRFREAMRAALDLAGGLQAGLIHVMAGIPPDGADPAACRHTFCENLTWAAAQARPRGIVLTIEPINRRDMPGYFLWQVGQAVQILDDLSLPNVRLQFDIYHAQVEGGDVASRMAAALPHVGHVQIANPPGRHGPGDGELDLPWLLRELDRLGYDGWVGCEYRPAGPTEGGLAWARPFGIHPAG
ncbi:hydroxypyruvate isomerase family protein [Marinibaculum pumilum]|uniref:Hydroxypyruvate isomerase family protein n=1 Tax=Marinibaculum pumilum TaxID=1766165 RepID=A0ABV7LAJ0_9PROT